MQPVQLSAAAAATVLTNECWRRARRTRRQECRTEQLVPKNGENQFSAAVQGTCTNWARAGLRSGDSGPSPLTQFADRLVGRRPQSAVGTRCPAAGRRRAGHGNFRVVCSGAAVLHNSTGTGWPAELLQPVQRCSCSASRRFFVGREQNFLQSKPNFFCSRLALCELFELRPRVRFNWRLLASVVSWH